MKHEDIIRMAREAGFPEHRAFSDLSDLYPRLERFAALVAKAECERIIAENAPVIEKINSYIKTIEDAVVAEREECAKVCEEMWTGYGDLGAICASTIRARSNQ